MTGRYRFGETARSCRICAIRGPEKCNAGAGARLGVAESTRFGQRALNAGAELFAQGEPCDQVYSLLDGWLATFQITPDGQRQILAFLMPGAVIAWRAEPCSLMGFGCLALTDAQICAVPRSEILGLIDENPRLALNFSEIAADGDRLLSDHLLSLGRRSAKQRIAHLLLELFCRQTGNMPKLPGESMPLPLSQTDIADAMGLTPVHVCRVLNSLKSDRIAIVKDRLLQVLDPGRLHDTASLDDETIELWQREATLRADLQTSESSFVRALRNGAAS